MEELLAINNLTVEVVNKKLIQNVSLTFYKGINVFLCGSSGSGKTILLEVIAKKRKYQGHIKYFSNVAVLFDQLYFSTSTLEDEMRYIYLTEDQKQFVHQFFDVYDLKQNPNQLDSYKKRLLVI